MSNGVTEWLGQLGLEQYVQAFAENDIHERILPDLTDADLKELGVTSLGHRKVLLKGIASLQSEISAERLASPDAERRQLTVMFCDLVGSTELSQRLDPEDLRDVNLAFQDACKKAIERFDGYVARYMGDGVLAYFGYPTAHEDDAERAVRAGLGVVEAMGELNARKDQVKSVELAVRIGIATGPVVVGDLIGEGASQESAVVGETPNLAARLQGIARPNSTVIAPGTKRLVGGMFDYRDVGERELKGIAEPVHVWEVTGASEIESRFEATRGTLLTPLVGRDGELDLLLARWQQASKGKGQLVMISGEPGIGKSRITEAVLERITKKPHMTLRYYCSPHHSDSALHPVMGQLERAAGFSKDDTASVKLDKLEAVLGLNGEWTSEVMSFLAAILSIPADGRYPPSKLTSQAQKSRAFDALVKQLEGLAAIRPVLMVLEDAHWLDPTTIELFGHIIDRIQDLPVQLLITHRPEFEPPWAGFATSVTSLALNRLGRHQGQAMVERVSGGKTMPAEVLEQILLKTDGVPLFVEEFTKAILESGLLEDAGDSYELAGPFPDLVIPTTLHDSLMYRLDRQASVKEIVLVGSVIGREFSFELLAAVTSLSDHVLEKALSQLVESELAFRRGYPPEAIYTFKHALVQDAAYQSLLNSRKRQLHGRIAVVLEEKFPESADTEPELLAHHFTAADMAERAITYWMAAGQRALSSSSLSEAFSHLSKALELTERIENEFDRAERELETRTALGAATMAIYGWPAPEIRDVIKPACDLFEQGHGTSDAFMNLWNLWVHHACRAEHKEGLSVVDRMLKHANERNDPVLRMIASFTAAMANHWVGNYHLVPEYERSALEAYEFERDGNLVWSYNHDPKNTLLSWASHRAWALGYPDRARGLSDEAVAHARKVGHPFNLCWTLGNSSTAYAYCGEYEKARARIEELRCIASEQQLPFMEHYMVSVELSLAAAQAGDHQIAYEQGVRGEEIWRAVGGRFYSPTLRAYMAEACLHLDRIDEAVELVDDSIERIETTGERIFAEEIYRLAGLVHLKHNQNQDKAVALFQKSLDYSREHGTKSFELRTSLSLAQIWCEQGKRREARGLLSSVYHWFTEGSDTADLKDAQGLLERLS